MKDMYMLIIAYLYIFQKDRVMITPLKLQPAKFARWEFKFKLFTYWNF